MFHHLCCLVNTTTTIIIDTTRRDQGSFCHGFKATVTSRVCSRFVWYVSYHHYSRTIIATTATSTVTTIISPLFYFYFPSRCGKWSRDPSRISVFIYKSVVWLIQGFRGCIAFRGKRLIKTRFKTLLIFDSWGKKTISQVVSCG